MERLVADVGSSLELRFLMVCCSGIVYMCERIYTLGVSVCACESS